MFVDDPHLDAALRGGLLAALALAWVVVLTRINGLQSFSKMTSFDFVTTVAVGSILASAAQSTSWTGFVQALASLAALFLAQGLLSRSRVRWPAMDRVVQNQPRLLVHRGTFLDGTLRDVGVARADVLAKLREANVGQLSEVSAVVLETTGDISVLAGNAPYDAVLDDVRGAGACRSS